MRFQRFAPFGIAFVLRSWVSQGEEQKPGQLPEVAARSDAEGRVDLLAEHREGIWATCLLLEPGETRVLSVELFRNTSLEGEIRRASSGAAVEGALVVLFAPAEVGDSPSSPLRPKGMSKGNDLERRRELARTTTDAAGRFRLENLQPGTWILTATNAGERTDARTHGEPCRWIDRPPAPRSRTCASKVGIPSPVS
ncbi:MAG: carboxypeptidase regulatory-like domain-containing protein [Planctomycetes bacterium]|nr:carboxypeptidase regulatory-like domain-containing protein [Planctomycetota bacterium]